MLIDSLYRPCSVLLKVVTDHLGRLACHDYELTTGYFTSGPWNISSRLEKRLGPRLKVDAVIEINGPRAETALTEKRKSFVHEAYADTMVLPDVEEFKRRVSTGEAQEPR